MRRHPRERRAARRCTPEGARGPTARTAAVARGAVVRPGKAAAATSGDKIVALAVGARQRRGRPTSQARDRRRVNSTECVGGGGMQAAPTSGTTTERLGSGDDTYFQHHAAQLRGKQQLLSLRDQRVDNKVLAHICNHQHVSARSRPRLSTTQQRR